MANFKPELPIINLYSLADLERMVLIQTLAAQGVDDPPAFIEGHVIKYKCALKGNVGMAITIVSISPLKPKGSAGASEGP